MSDIAGIEVLLHDRCRSCGTNIAVVRPRQLWCDACGIGRGLIGSDLRTFLEKFVEFGRPERPIVLRTGKVFGPEPPASAAEPETAKRKRKGKSKMKMQDLFPSKYLRAADLRGESRIVIIDHVTHEDFKDDGVTVKKTILNFKGNDTHPVVLNKTNWKMLVAITGEDDDENWAGTKIELRCEKVNSKGGKIVDSIRVHEVAKPAKAKATVDAEMNDEIDF